VLTPHSQEMSIVYHYVPGLQVNLITNAREVLAIFRENSFEERLQSGVILRACGRKIKIFRDLFAVGGI
jgi:hypothetical protein